MENVENSKAARYVCKICGYVYDPAENDPPIPFEDLDDDWTCPECGVGLEEFEKQV